MILRHFYSWKVLEILLVGKLISTVTQNEIKVCLPDVCICARMLCKGPDLVCYRTYFVLSLLQHFDMMCFTSREVLFSLWKIVLLFSNFVSDVRRWHITCIWEGCVVILNLVFIVLLLLNFNLNVFDFHNNTYTHEHRHMHEHVYIRTQKFFIVERISETTCCISCSKGFALLLQWKLPTSTVILEVCSAERWSFMMDSCGCHD
jgi:hypothetical protein